MHKQFYCDVENCSTCRELFLKFREEVEIKNKEIEAQLEQDKILGIKRPTLRDAVDAYKARTALKEKQEKIDKVAERSHNVMYHGGK